uniref:Uncharacterized protein n=1 Tax=Eptatretus burgeri TaxID=7764 RepID=A0A8C4Q7G6_EPTBU
MLLKRFNELKSGINARKKAFVTCHKKAEELLQKCHTRRKEIYALQKELRETWDRMLELEQKRGEMLQQAEEAHNYLRSLDDALLQIQEKEAGIPNELGRDLRTSQEQLRRIEGMENETVLMEQLQELMEQGQNVLQDCPDGLQASVVSRREAVTQAWTTLDKVLDQQKRRLQRSCMHHLFLSKVLDYSLWAGAALRGLQARESGHGSQHLQMEQIEAEITAHTPDFGAAVQFGEELLTDNHSDNSQVKQKLMMMHELKKQLQREFDAKRNWLEQMSKEQSFLRDVEQAERLVASQEARLQATVPESPEGLESASRRLETSAKVLTAQEDKVQALINLAELLGSGEFTRRATALKQRQSRVLDHLATKREELELARLMLQFNRDCHELASWIEDMGKRMTDGSGKGAHDLQEKMKLLQRHQGFQADVQAHADMVHDITEVCFASC